MEDAMFWIINKIMVWFIMPLLVLFFLAIPVGLLYGYFHQNEEQTVSLGMNSWQCIKSHEVWIPYERVGKVAHEAHSEIRCDEYARRQQ